MKPRKKYLSAKQIQVLEILFDGGMIREIYNEPLFMETGEGNVIKITYPTFNLLLAAQLIEKGLRLSDMCQEYKLTGKGFHLVNEL